MITDERDHDRADAVLIRMSHARKAELKAEAASLGLTLQALAERRLLGIADAQNRKHGRVPRSRQDQELPLTG